MTTDDSANLRQMVGFVLKGAGFGVIEAWGMDAWSKRPDETVNLVWNKVMR